MITILLLKALFNKSKNLTLIQSQSNFILKQANSLLFLLAIFFCCYSLSSLAKQENPFENTANIYSTVQDNKGFIWLSGQNGLFRFDGEQSINFSNKDSSWNIPFNWINDISVRNDHLVLSTETKGLWLFNTSTAITEKININSPTKTFYRVLYHNNNYYALSMAPQNLYRYDIATTETHLLMANIRNSELFSTQNRVYFNHGDELFYIDSTFKVRQLKAIKETLLVTAFNRYQGLILFLMLLVIYLK